MLKKAIVFSACLMGQFSHAQTIVTDRPDQTESPSAIPQGSFQLETGIVIGFSENDEVSEQQILAPTTLFRIGIVKGLEIRVVNQLENIKIKNSGESSFGISDLEVGAKLELLHKDNLNTKMAFLSHLILPTGSKELTSNTFGTVNKLAVSHSIAESLDLGYNIGYNYFGEDNGDLTYSVALGIGLTDTLGLYVETYGEWIKFEDFQSNFDAGFTYLVNNNLQLDVSFGTGINHTMNYISAGCSINFSKTQ
ncbi:MAG: transporter [Gelidibacter sp.]